MTRTAARRTAEPFDYVDIYRAAPDARIRLIKTGVSAAKAKRMIADLDFDQQAFLGALNLSPATVNRKAARHETLAPDESERVVGVAKLVGQVEAMIDPAARPAGFDAAAWLSRWLREPVPALGHARPIELLDTMEGQSMVAHALARIESGAYG